jgi:hypothetical protein
MESRMSADQVGPPEQRRSRFWLFAPFVALALAAVAWSAVWLIIRNRAEAQIDGWMAAEAIAGRQWSCPGRSVGGFPFRVEVTCPSLDLKRGAWTAAIGPFRTVAQIYQPNHVIAELAGPFRATDGRAVVEASWRNLRASFRGAGDRFERVSVTAEAPVVNIDGLPVGAFALRSERLEAHIRPHPRRADEGAIEVSAQASNAVAPMLDALVGGGEPATIDLALTATQARDAAMRSVAGDLERWRRAGGKLEVTRLSLVKASRRLEAVGEASLDELHRPAGRFEVSAQGVEGLIGNLTGGRLGGAAGALLGALLGERRRPAPEPSAGEGRLTPLPPLRIENGRISFGPLTIPGVRLSPLY